MSTSYWLAGKTITYSTASPEGVITAPPGSVNMAETGSLYVKSTGTGNTGWVALGASGAADVDFEVFTQPGTLTVGTGKARLKFPFSVTLQTVGIAVDTAPTGASLIVDVNKNGTTVFTTQANRPTITASGFASADMTPNTTAMATTDYLTIDIDQIGSTIAGADLTVFVKYTRP
jgi:hypothetical protein